MKITIIDFLKKSIYFRQFLYNFAQKIDKEFKIMKKSLGIIILLFVFTLKFVSTTTD